MINRSRLKLLAQVLVFLSLVSLIIGSFWIQPEGPGETTLVHRVRMAQLDYDHSADAVKAWEVSMKNVGVTWAEIFTWDTRNDPRGKQMQSDYQDYNKFTAALQTANQTLAAFRAERRSKTFGMAIVTCFFAIPALLAGLYLWLTGQQTEVT